MPNTKSQKISEWHKVYTITLFYWIAAVTLKKYIYFWEKMLKNSRSITKMNNMKVDNKIAMDSLDVTNEFSDFFF